MLIRLSSHAQRRRSGSQSGRGKLLKGPYSGGKICRWNGKWSGAKIETGPESGRISFSVQRESGRESFQTDEQKKNYFGIKHTFLPLGLLRYLAFIVGEACSLTPNPWCIFKVDAYMSCI